MSPPTRPDRNPTIRALLDERPNEGELANPEGTGEVASLDGGDMIRLQLRISRDGGEIQTARYRTMGNELLPAVMETIIDGVAGMRLDAASTITWTYVADMLGDEHGPFPPDEVQLIPLGLDALRFAIRDFLDTEGRPKELDVILCRCLGVAEGTVMQAIEEQGLRTLEEVAEATDAGLGCNSCHAEIQRMLDKHWAKHNGNASGTA